MFYEYAVEPQAIASSWETFRYVIEKFGFDQGRLISEYPRRWLREVYDGTLGLSDLQRKRVEVALDQAKRNKIIRAGRPYDGQAGDWLHNAIIENQRLPFRAIIASQNPAGVQGVLPIADLEEQSPLMSVPRDSAVSRDAASLVAAMKELLRFSSRILFVDPHYSPYRATYKNAFRECFATVRSLNPNATCEIHYRYHDGKPSNSELERDAAQLFPGVVPNDMKVTIYCWRQKSGGEDFHDRFLLTERGGIAVGAGFEAAGNHETTNMLLMSYELSQRRLREFTRATACYDLIAPIIKAGGDGKAERIP